MQTGRRKKRCAALLLTVLLLLTVMLPAFPVNAYWFRENGVDVSVYQGNIDWETFAANNDMRFVIMRACKLPSPTEAFFVDDNFDRNYEGARSVGLKVGCYCRIAANSRDQLLQTTQRYLMTIAGKEFDMPVYLDLEDDSLKKIGSKSILTNAVIESMDMIAAAGYHPGLYANLNWYNNNLDGSLVKARGYDLWLARWTHDPDAQDFSTGYSVWQYSDKGSYTGMTGTAVDLDVSYVDYRYAGDHGRTIDPAKPAGQYLVPLRNSAVYYADGTTPTGMTVTTATPCYVQETYTNGLCRVLYGAYTGQRVGYLPLSVFEETTPAPTDPPATDPPTEQPTDAHQPEESPLEIPIEIPTEPPTDPPAIQNEPEQDPLWNGIVPVQAKVLDDTYCDVYEADCETWNGDVIDPADECTIEAAFVNGWCRVSYPSGGAVRTGYLRLSDFFMKERKNFGQLYTSAAVTTYERFVTAPTGSIPAKNLVIYTGEDASMIQVIYASSGKRYLSWISKREWYEILLQILDAHIHGKQPLVERQCSLVDCDHDGVIDVFDLALIKWRLDHVID